MDDRLEGLQEIRMQWQQLGDELILHIVHLKIDRGRGGWQQLDRFWLLMIGIWMM